MPAVLAVPAFWGAVTAASAGTAAVVGAKMQSGAAKDAAVLQTDAAKYGADKQDEAAQRAEAFQRQQAENAWQNAQSTQQANYNQAKARFGTIAGVGAQYGLPGMTMPDYVPGIDPRYTDASTPLPSQSATPNPAGTVAGAAGAPPSGNFSDPAYAASFVKYYAAQPGANPSLQRDPNYWVGKITSGELGTDPKYIVSKFMTPEGAPAGSIGGATKPLPSAAIAPTYSTPQVTTAIPTPYQPGTIRARRSY